MTKSELRQVIREMLHEELSVKKGLKESHVRNSLEIKAEIEKLKQELQVALDAEREEINKADIVWMWRIASKNREDDVFFSAEQIAWQGNKWIGEFFATKEQAIKAGNKALDCDYPIERDKKSNYTVSAVTVPRSEINIG